MVLTDLARTDMAENVEDAFRHSKLVVAAASYDAGIFSPMHDFLHRLKIKGYCNRTVGILENGSWAPSAGRVARVSSSTRHDATKMVHAPLPSPTAHPTS